MSMTIGVDVRKNDVSLSVFIDGKIRETIRLPEVDSEKICRLLREQPKAEVIDCPDGGMVLPKDWNIQQFIRGTVEPNEI
jgi:hypothetical protein